MDDIVRACFSPSKEFGVLKYLSDTMYVGWEVTFPRLREQSIQASILIVFKVEFDISRNVDWIRQLDHKLIKICLPEFPVLCSAIFGNALNFGLTVADGFFQLFGDKKAGFFFDKGHRAVWRNQSLCLLDGGHYCRVGHNGDVGWGNMMGCDFDRKAGGLICERR